MMFAEDVSDCAKMHDLFSSMDLIQSSHACGAIEDKSKQKNDQMGETFFTKSAVFILGVFGDIWIQFEIVSKIVDLRSYIITKPTEAMRAAMAGAEVDDDVIGHDPTVDRPAAKMAKIIGKEEEDREKGEDGGVCGYWYNDAYANLNG